MSIEPSAVRPPSGWEALDDPEKDGWLIEALANVTQKRLNRIGELLHEPEEIGVDALLPMTVEETKAAVLTDADASAVLDDGLFVVRRASGEPVSSEFSGPHALREALIRFAAPLAGCAHPHFKAKIIRVSAADGKAVTKQVVTLSGKVDGGMVEQRTVWTILWVPGGDGRGPRIERITSDTLEVVKTRSASGPLFSDCTESVLAGNDCWEEQLVYGHNHWLMNLEENRGAEFIAYPGIAVGDANGDGLDDLYACQGIGLPNRLFLQQKDGSAWDVSAESGVDWLEDSRSALLVDLDNDGDQDLAVAVIGAVVLAENDGTGRFQVAAVSEVDDDTMSLSAADVDLDGDLDLYVCGYYEEFLQPKLSHFNDEEYSDFVYHDANNGGRNVLLLNEGGWRFTDATRSSGLGVNNTRYSFAGVFEDYDSDGDPDLYVANDYGRDAFYRNELAETGELRFTYASDEAGADPGANGMAVTWGDPNRDGQMDVYVSNMWSSAGNRVTHSEKFKPGSKTARERLQRFAKGNTLLENGGDGTFRDVSDQADVTLGRWAWGSAFADINNDGWEDLVVANGYVTTEDTSDL
ncbi:MAG: VCBS repeat-containing protein [Planctomycetota bacterium]